MNVRKATLSGKRLAIALTYLVFCVGLFLHPSVFAIDSAMPAETALPTPMPSPLPKESVLTEEDDGHTINAYKGQVLVISLESNPSTGYTWEVTEIDETVLRQVRGIEFEPESDLLGAPGKQILRFEAVGIGQAPLKLVYHRPWERGMKSAGEFSIQVVVQPPPN